MAQRVKLCPADEIPPGGSKPVIFQGRDLRVIHHGENYYAVGNQCPHIGGPLGLGEVKHGIITCPWHRFRFDLETGRSVTNPSMRAPICRLEVNQRDLWLDPEALEWV